MATKYFKNYAAKAYAQDVHAGLYKEQAERTERAQKKQEIADTQEMGKSLHTLYSNVSEGIASHKLDKSHEGVKLYQEKELTSKGPVEKFIKDRYVPTKTKMSYEGAGELMSGETGVEGTFDLYKDKDWKGLYSEAYSELASEYDSGVGGITGGQKNYHDVFKSKDKDIVSGGVSELQGRVSDKLGLQGEALEEFLGSEKYSTLASDIGSKSSKGLKVGESIDKFSTGVRESIKGTKAYQGISKTSEAISQSAETLKASKFGQTFGNIANKAGTVAAIGGGGYQAYQGVKEYQEGNEGEGAYKVASGTAKVAAAALAAAPEPVISKGLALGITVGTMITDKLVDEGILG